MYTVSYHARKVIVPFKNEPKRYKATMRDEAGKIAEIFIMGDKRKLKNLLRRCGYIK